jgi:multiple antibiotic resistance protein
MDLVGLGQLVVLFFVIIDPLTSFSVFFVLTKDKTDAERMRAATLALVVAATLAFIVLLLGTLLLSVFSTTIEDLRVAGGIILLILGIQMALGMSFPGGEVAGNHRSVQAIASIIATPFLSGPATITAIIISESDFGLPATGIAVTIVLAFTTVLFLLGTRLNRFIPKTPVQIMATVLGIITIAWGVNYIRTGIVAALGL